MKDTSLGIKLENLIRKGKADEETIMKILDKELKSIVAERVKE